MGAWLVAWGVLDRPVGSRYNCDLEDRVGALEKSGFGPVREDRWVRSKMARKGKHRRRVRDAARRVEAILARVKGHSGDDFDRRREERPPPARILSLPENGRLFDRVTALDFAYLLSRRFAADPTTLRLLLPQSVLGRAQNGHGWFRDESGVPLQFPQATFDRVLSVFEGEDPALRNDAVRQERGRRLEELRGYLLGEVDRIVAVGADARLQLEIVGEPLLGVTLLAGRDVDARAFLTGLVLAGYMDDFQKREVALSYCPICFDGSPLQLGGGGSYIVHPERLAATGIVDPGRVEFDEREIAHLRDLGVIVSDVCEDADRIFEYPEFEQVYFRRRLGEGICDDLALIYVGARHGFDGMLGAFVMDAVDTYDKYLWRFANRGFDTLLATAIQDRFRQLTGKPLVGDEPILDLIAFAAKMNSPPCALSSSHRRLIQVEPGSEVPTLLNHWHLLAGEPLYEIELGFSRFPARQFYDIARQRLASIGVAVPRPQYVIQK